MTRTIRLAVTAIALSCALPCPGVPPAHGEMMRGGRRRPEFLRQLFPPQLIMQHQGDIGLRDDQRRTITREMAVAEKGLIDVRWQLEEKTAALTKLLAADTVDEAAVMARVDEVLKLENEMKRLRLGLLVRLKNVLTPEQQKTLRKLQPPGRGGLPGRHGPDAPESEP